MSFLFITLTILLANNFLVRATANPTGELENHQCQDMQAEEPNLERVLNEARGGAMTVTHKDWSELNLRTVTDSSSDHCPNTITGRKNSRHPNARAVCPWYVLLSFTAIVLQYHHTHVLILKGSLSLVMSINFYTSLNYCTIGMVSA